LGEQKKRKKCKNKNKTYFFQHKNNFKLINKIVSIFYTSKRNEFSDKIFLIVAIAIVIVSIFCFFNNNYNLGVPPRYARGRRTAASTRAVAVGSQSRKKSLQARFFAAASPASPTLAGFPPPASRRRSFS